MQGLQFPSSPIIFFKNNVEWVTFACDVTGPADESNRTKRVQGWSRLNWSGGILIIVSCHIHFNKLLMPLTPVCCFAKSNPKTVHSLFRSIAGSPSSSSSFPNFLNYSSPRKLALVYAAYLRSHFSVSQPKILRSRARGYLSELRRATCPEESHSSFCSPFSLQIFLESFCIYSPAHAFLLLLRGPHCLPSLSSLESAFLHFGVHPFISMLPL